MTSTKETTKASGLNIWSSDSASRSPPEVDIVAVQGLGAHPFYTWVKKIPSLNAAVPRRLRDRIFFRNGEATEGNDGNDCLTEVMWPRDLLVPLFKDARIATYSYESDWKNPKIKTNLRECAEQFLNILLQHRRNDNERQRPLVLIGHSLGGLVVQQALVTAVHQREFTDIRLSVAGIIFLGAPFQGSNAAAYGMWLAQVAGLDSTLLELLKKDSPSLQALSRDFWGSYSDYDIVCFYEKREADYGPWKTRFVTQQSASLLGKRTMFLDTDHSGMNKFGGMNDENFELLLPEIKRLIDGGSVIDRHRRNDPAKIEPAKPAGNVHWMVSRTVNNLFTGRIDLLDRIRNALLGDRTSCADQQKTFVITGLGGQGKSEVCLKLANLVKEDFWGVFWVDIGSPSLATSGFIAIAKVLGSSVENISDALQVLTNTKKNWLLILDNADDPNFDYQRYLPSGPHGAVIITSRVSNCSHYSTVGSEALTGLDTQHSTHLLLKAAEIPEESWPSHDRQAKEVATLLGSHTLALIQAGAYIARGPGRLDQYPEVYQRQRKRLLEYRPVQARSRYGDVYATFEASANVLEQSEKEAAKDAVQLLEILSMLHHNFLPIQIFEDAWNGSSQVLHTDDTEPILIESLRPWHVYQMPNFMEVEGLEWDAYRFDEASSMLVSLSLVIRNSSAGVQGLSMHPLTHAWARDRQESDQQGQAWIATGSILSLSSFNENKWWDYERYLQPHVQSYLDINARASFLLKFVPTVTPILLKCGRILLRMREDSRLDGLLIDVFALLKIDPTIPSEEFLDLYNLKARSLGRLGEHAKAVKLLGQIVEIHKATLEENHPNLLTSQHYLARAYKRDGQIRQAVKLLEQIFEIEKITLKETHPNRLASQYELALAYLKNEQVSQAIELLEHVVKIQEITLLETHFDRLISQHELAKAYLKNEQVSQAIELLEHVVKIREITLLETHSDRLISQHTLATAYLDNGQASQAIELLEHVIEIRERTLAEDHPDRVGSQRALARAYEANEQVGQNVGLQVDN